MLYYNKKYHFISVFALYSKNKIINIMYFQIEGSFGEVFGRIYHNFLHSAITLAPSIRN